ncbi:MAG: thioesterase family protein [Alphaproteobacteria bacterium]|nr:thioesterase family protein [Alphaproteobacteria bacterium]
MKFAERLGGSAKDGSGGGEWQFDLAEELNGGFGGTNGGNLAAICVFAARGVAPGRRPIGLDARFIRSFRPGLARVVPTVLNAGRTLTTVSVDIFTADDKLATRGTVGLVALDALAEFDADAASGQDESLMSYEDGKPWRHPSEKYRIPLIDTFAPRYLGKSDGAIATGSKIIWDYPDASIEAACVAADISVGPPVSIQLKGKPLAIPNPDLSLRFTANNSDVGHLVSTCRLESLTGGLATTSLEVRAGDDLLAVGIATTTILKG